MKSGRTRIGKVCQGPKKTGHSGEIKVNPNTAKNRGPNTQKHVQKINEKGRIRRKKEKGFGTREASYNMQLGPWKKATVSLPWGWGPGFASQRGWVGEKNQGLGQ